MAKPLSAPPDHAVALGMIVNELVTNAIKYAYPDGKGPIRVALRNAGDGRAALTVEDDGGGSKSDTGRPSTGLGQRIVRAMGDKIRAKIEPDALHAGTRVVVTFDAAAKQTASPPP
jgi:two-component sensor histidine kinase